MLARGGHVGGVRCGVRNESAIGRDLEGIIDINREKTGWLW